MWWVENIKTVYDKIDKVVMDLNQITKHHFWYSGGPDDSTYPIIKAI